MFPERPNLVLWNIFKGKTITAGTLLLTIYKIMKKDPNISPFTSDFFSHFLTLAKVLISFPPKIFTDSNPILVIGRTL